jgi:hypothetical protein
MFWVASSTKKHGWEIPSTAAHKQTMEHVQAMFDYQTISRKKGLSENVVPLFTQWFC